MQLYSKAHPLKSAPTKCHNNITRLAGHEDSRMTGNVHRGELEVEKTEEKTIFQIPVPIKEILQPHLHYT